MEKAAAMLIVEKAQPELRLRSLVRMLLSLRMGVSLPKLLKCSTAFKAATSEAAEEHMLGRTKRRKC